MITLSSDLIFWIHVVTKIILGTPLCLLGIIANIINFIVIIDRGFKDTVNISLLSLAVSDTCILVTLQWINIIYYPRFTSPDIPWRTTRIVYLAGAALRSDFTRVTGWITAFMSLERCLCAMMPLKVKLIFTAKVTLVVNIVIFVVVMSTHLPDYLTLYLGWTENKTVFGIVARDSRSSVGNLSFVLSDIWKGLSFVAVAVLTVILIIQLWKQSKWRNSVMSAKTETAKHQEVHNYRTMKMILLVAIIYIVCCLPGFIVCSLVIPELNVKGLYVDDLPAAWALGFLAEAINSSVGIFVYYSMSSKYRQAFDRRWKRVCGREKGGK